MKNLDTIATEVRVKNNTPLQTLPDNNKGYPLQTVATKAPTKETPMSANWEKGGGTFQSVGTTVPTKPNTPRQAYDTVSYSDRALQGKRKNY